MIPTVPEAVAVPEKAHGLEVSLKNLLGVDGPKEDLVTKKKIQRLSRAPNTLPMTIQYTMEVDHLIRKLKKLKCRSFTSDHQTITTPMKRAPTMLQPFPVEVSRMTSHSKSLPKQPRQRQAAMPTEIVLELFVVQKIANFTESRS
jgi:hypothetical protein